MTPTIVVAAVAAALDVTLLAIIVWAVAVAIRADRADRADRERLRSGQP